MQAILRTFMRATVKQVMGPPLPVSFQRNAVTLLSYLNLVKRRTSFSPKDLGGVPGQLIEKESPGQQAILYLHGGGYCLGSPQTHRAMLSHLADRSGARIHVPDYRLAPEYPFPAALNDALASFEAMLTNGIQPADITIAGDSAGGGLALATAHAIRDRGLPLPAALVLLSPWADLRLEAESLATHASRDPVLKLKWLNQCAHSYAADTGADHPGLSPLLGNHAGLPPVLIQVGSDEILLDDAQDLAAALRAAGVKVHLREYKRMWHVFQLHAGMLGEADQALDEISNFMRAIQASKSLHQDIA